MSVVVWKCCWGCSWMEKGGSSIGRMREWKCGCVVGLWRGWIVFLQDGEQVWTFLVRALGWREYEKVV